MVIQGGQGPGHCLRLWREVVTCQAANYGSIGHHVYAGRASESFEITNCNRPGSCDTERSFRPLTFSKDSGQNRNNQGRGHNFTGFAVNMEMLSTCVT